MNEPNHDPGKVLRRVVMVLAVIAFLMAVTLAGLLVRKAILERADAPEASAEGSASAPVEPEASASPDAQASPDAAASPTPGEQQASDVQRILTDFVAAQGGTWDVYYTSLSTGDTAAAQRGHDAEPRSVAASLIKLFVMGAVYDAVDRGTLTHDAVYNDLYSMITISDNSACNRLVTLLGGGDAAKGMQTVNSFAAALGCSGTQMNRLMLQPGTENYVTARDCAVILRAIYNGACVSADASAEMLKLLRAQTVNDRLPADLPQGAAVAHKTGNLANLSCGDVGIIFSPAGDYILCAISNHAASDAADTAAIATLSRTVYDAVQK